MVLTVNLYGQLSPTPLRAHWYQRQRSTSKRLTTHVCNGLSGFISLDPFPLCLFAAYEYACKSYVRR